MTLGVPSPASFKCKLPFRPCTSGSPVGPKILLPTPGCVLPNCYQSSTALFGASPDKTGSSKRLQLLADTVPVGAPRYMTHDLKSASSSGYSNFTKTTLVFGGNTETASGKHRDWNTE